MTATEEKLIQALEAYIGLRVEASEAQAAASRESGAMLTQMMNRFGELQKKANNISKHSDELRKRLAEESLITSERIAELAKERADRLEKEHGRRTAALERILELLEHK